MRKLICIFVLCMAGLSLWAGNNDSIQAKIDNRAASEMAYYDSSFSTIVAQESFVKTLLKNLVPIVAISFPFLFAVLTVFFVLWYKYKDNKRRYVVLEKALEAGRDLPDNFFQTQKKMPHNRLSNSVMLMGVGLGVAIFGAIIDQIEVCALAVIPFILGVGQFVVYIIEKREAKQNRPIEGERQE